MSARTARPTHSFGRAWPVLIALAASAGCAAPSALAEETAAEARPKVAMMARQEAHDRLDFFVGDWTGTFVADMQGLGYAEPQAFTASVRFAWMEPGRVWLREEAVLEPPWGATFGQGMWTYDAASEQYVRRWVDNQTSEEFVNVGFWEDESTLVIAGHVDYGGARRQLRNVFRITGPNSFEWKHYSDRGQGGDFHLGSTATYARVTP